jgi:hypothetical protein
MPGKQRQKVFCQAITRKSIREGKPRGCLAKGYLCANGRYLCRFHGSQNLLGFNKVNYNDKTRIKQLSKLYQFRNKTKEEVQEYYYNQVKPRIIKGERSKYNRRKVNQRRNPFRSNQTLSVQLDEILRFLKKKSKVRSQDIRSKKDRGTNFNR